MSTYLLGRLVNAEIGGLQVDLWVLWGFVGRVEPGEVGDFAGTRLLVEALRVSRLTDFERGIDEDLDELSLRHQSPNPIAVFAIRRNERGDDERPGI